MRELVFNKITQLKIKMVCSCFSHIPEEIMETHARSWLGHGGGDRGRVGQEMRSGHASCLSFSAEKTKS